MYCVKVGRKCVLCPCALYSILKGKIYFDVRYIPYLREIDISTIFNHVTIDVPPYSMIASNSNIDSL